MRLVMLDSGLEGAVFAVLTAVLGRVQALLFLRHRRPRAHLFDFWTLYFSLQLVTAIMLLCVWKTATPSTHRRLVFQMLLESAWIEGMAIVMCLCLRIVFANHTVRAMFCCVATVAVVLHTLGFALLALDQNSGKSILLGASLLVPTSLLVAFVQIRCSQFDKGRRPIVIGVYSLLNVCGFLSLTAIQDADKFLQANVILITVTNLILVSLPLIRSPRISGEIRSHHPRSSRLMKGMRRDQSGSSQPLDNSLTSTPRPFNAKERPSDGLDAPSLRSEQDTCKSNESRPRSLLLPSAPTYPTPSYKPDPATTPAFLSAKAYAIHVTTEVETTVSAKQDGLSELETRVSADIHTGYGS